MQNNSKKSVIIIATAVVLVLGGIVAFAGGLFGGSNSNNSNNNSQPVTVNSNGSNNSVPPPQDTGNNNNQTALPVSSKKYINGVYTTTGSYRSPGGQEQFNLSITLKNDFITSATFTPKAVSGRGMRFQTQFSQGFGQQVVGKNIDQVSIYVVNGASLTSAGFMNALQQIKQQALSAAA